MSRDFLLQIFFARSRHPISIVVFPKKIRGIGDVWFFNDLSVASDKLFPLPFVVHIGDKLGVTRLLDQATWATKQIYEKEIIAAT